MEIFLRIVYNLDMEIFLKIVYNLDIELGLYVFDHLMRLGEI